MLRLYDYLPSGNGYKIRLALARLALPYELVEVDIHKAETRTPEFLRRNPIGRVPVLELEDGTPLAESNAILWYLAAPAAFLGRGGGKRKGPESVKAVRAARMRLGIADATGRQAPEEIQGASFDLPADLVLKALGFDPEDVPGAFGAPELAVTRWGTLKIDWRTMMTSLDGVFAAGDIVRGASLVVWAIRDGRDAALAIHKHLAKKAVAMLSAAAD